MTLTGFARIVCAVVLAIAASITTATQGTQQLALSQQTHQVFELGAGAPLHVFTLTIGTSRTLTLDVTSKVSAVNVEILTPSGTPIDPALVERFTVGPGEVPPLGALLFEEGFHVQTQINSPTAGTWTVRVTLPVGVTTAFGNISAFVTGGLSAGVTTSRPSYQVSDTAVVALVAFRDGVPVTGATATANVYVAGPGAAPAIVTLLDDGQNEDVAAGDGIYSGGLMGLAPGHYLVSAVAQLGDEQATGATNFDVTAALARLTETKTDAGLDTNADGLFEWIGVDIGVAVDSAATYEVFISLRSSSNSSELTAAARAMLAVGSQSIQVRFSAADIRGVLATNGPWEVPDVRIVPISTDGIATGVVADRIDDLGLTGAYSLAQLQRPVTQIIAGMTERGVDTNGNGLFDLLQTTFQVDTLRAGSYTWTGTLRSTDGAALSVASGQGTLAAGMTTLGFTFDGKLIGASGVDGPYGLFDVAVYGPPDAAALMAAVGNTQPYSASQFEGSQVTLERLIELVSAVFIGGRGGVPFTDGIRKSLIQKLTQAQSQAASNQRQAAIGLLDAFVNELRALADERIMPVEKERLVEFANRLRERLENP